MKTGKKRIVSLSSMTFKRLKFSFPMTYNLFKNIVTELNREYAKAILANNEGIELSGGLGRLIILKNKPYPKKLYSMTRPGTRITNLHSFGYVYKVYHKEKQLIKYPYIFKFRPHRQNIKIPLWQSILTYNESYYKLRSDG